MDRNKQTVLVVDDEPRNLELLKHMLTAVDCSVATAANGREALERCDQGGIDLVLLDVMMPELDGFDVLMHLRSRPQEEYVPVVLVTALSDREARLRGLEAGADDFLEKPIDRAVLLARVRTLLRLREAQRALLDHNATLELLQKQQRALTRFIVHDLRSPLSGVLLSLSYLDSVLPTGGEWQEVTRDALSSAQLASLMVMDLLDVALLEESGRPLVKELIAVGELLRSVAEGFRNEAGLREVSIEVNADASVRVQADRALLERSLWNLVRNAIRLAPPGGRVGLAVERTTGARIEVSNTGDPIPSELHPVLFDKFPPKAVRALGAGQNGVGLHFCGRVAAAHGGRISIETIPGWSTSFVIHLPTPLEVQP